MGASAATIGKATGVRKRLRKSPFFALLGCFMLAFAVGGFWPQYFAAAVGGTPAESTRFWLIHLHAALFTIWLLLYISQAGLILSGRVRMHLKLGPWLAAYGFAIAAVGLYAAVLLADRFGERLRDQEEAAAFVLFPLIDMVFFAGFLAAAMAWRKRPALHKRAMLVATFSIAIVGGGRLVARMIELDNPWIWQPLMLAPLLLAAAYDLFVCRRFYAVTTAGLAVHLARLNADTFSKSDSWLPLGRAILAPLQ